MLPDAKIHDLYAIWGNRVLTVAQYPRVVKIDFELHQKPHSLTLVGPSPYTEVIRVCDDECCRITIVDRNVEEPNCLEFARYRIELWTEDNLITKFVADKIRLSSEGEPAVAVDGPASRR